MLDGIKAKVGDRVKVLHSEGCKITADGGSWQRDEVHPSDPADDRRQIAEAVKVAQQADVIVLALGGNEQTSREAWNLRHMGDRTSLDLMGRQDELVKAMLGTGKPVNAMRVSRNERERRRLNPGAQHPFAKASGRLPVLPQQVNHQPAGDDAADEQTHFRITRGVRVSD